jgi:hypothetical protein
MLHILLLQFTAPDDPCLVRNSSPMAFQSLAMAQLLGQTDGELPVTRA